MESNSIEYLTDKQFMPRLLDMAHEANKKDIDSIDIAYGGDGEVTIYGIKEGQSFLLYRLNVEIIMLNDDGWSAHIKPPEVWTEQLRQLFNMLRSNKRKPWSISPKNQLKPFLTPMQEVMPS